MRTFQQTISKKCNISGLNIFDASNEPDAPP